MTRYLPLLLIVATLIALFPLLTGDFTTWDDSRTVVENPWLNPPALAHFAEFWNPTKPFMDIWIPLTYTVWSGVAWMARVPTPDPETGASLNPWLFHQANVAVHLCSVLLVFAILRKLVGRPWPAAAGALLFAIHPVQVEPVGWISGMKDVLAGCLSLFAIWQYLLFAGVAAISLDSSREIGNGPGLSAAPLQFRTRQFHYLLATAAFVLAMLSKPSAIVVPLLLFAIDAFLLKHPPRAIIRSLLPWLILTIPIILEGRFAQPAKPGIPTIPLYMRPLITTDALAFYLYKLLLPLRLCITYDRLPQSALAHGWPFYTWVAPIAVALLAVLWRKRFPWLLAAVAVFWLAVLPVLGLVPFDFQEYSTVADHYLYLAMLGPALAVAFLMRQIGSSRIVQSLAVCILVALGFISFLQSLTWKNSISVFAQAVKVNPQSCPAQNNLALAYASAGRAIEAIDTLEAGVARLPNCFALHYNLADRLADRGLLQEAERQYLIAAELSPGSQAVKAGLSRVNERRRQKPQSPATAQYSGQKLQPGGSTAH